MIWAFPFDISLKIFGKRRFMLSHRRAEENNEEERREGHTTAWQAASALSFLSQSLSGCAV
jgi:hypothetical protein